MLRRMILLVMMFGATGAFAQEDSVFQSVRSQTILNRLAGKNGIGRTDMIAELKLPPKRLIGTTYLNSDWTVAVILLNKKGQVLDGVPIKYDAQRNEFDVQTPGGVKLLDGNLVRSFAWRDKETGEVEDFENVKNYKQDIYPAGMFRRLTTGNLSVLAMTEVSIRKADYNVALNVGSTNDEVIKKDKLYYVADDGNVTRLPKTQKKFLEIFGSSSGVIKEYMTSRALSIAIPRDVQNIFTYYKTLNQ